MFKNNHMQVIDTETFKKGGKVKRSHKIKQKQKQSQSTRININIGTSKKRKSSKRKVSREPDVIRAPQIIPQYIQTSGPMVNQPPPTSVKEASSASVGQALNLDELSRNIGNGFASMEQRLGQGIPLSNVEELSGLIRQGIDTAKKLGRPKPRRQMYDDDIASSGYSTPPEFSSASFFAPTLFNPNFNKSPLPAEPPLFSSSSSSDVNFPMVQKPLEDPVSMDNLSINGNLQDYYFPRFKEPSLPPLPNLPIQLAPIDDEKEEQEIYPIVPFVENAPMQEPGQVVASADGAGFVQKNVGKQPLYDTGFEFVYTSMAPNRKDSTTHRRKIYLTNKNNIYFNPVDDQWKNANNLITPKHFAALKQFVSDNGLTYPK